MARSATAPLCELCGIVLVKGHQVRPERVGMDQRVEDAWSVRSAACRVWSCWSKRRISSSSRAAASGAREAQQGSRSTRDNATAADQTDDREARSAHTRPVD